MEIYWIKVGFKWVSTKKALFCGTEDITDGGRSVSRRTKIVVSSMLCIVIIIVVLLLQDKVKYDSIEKIKYNKFIELVESGEVGKVKYNQSIDIILYEDIHGNQFKTDNPKSTDFKKYLLENDIDLDILDAGYLIAIVNVLFGVIRLAVIVLLFKFVMDKAGVKLLEKKKTEVVNIPNVRFEDIAGNIESKKDMRFLVDFLKNPEKYHDMGAKLPKGVVLYGPPGTGKTLTAKVIAGEAGVPFLYMLGSDFVEMYVGLGAKRVRDLFKEAREKAPCIIFIDEIDAIGTRRGGHIGNSEKDQTINALLAELDGFNTKEPVIVIVATNRIEDLDPALVRPGRFDRHIAINLPEYQDRLDILKTYSKDKRLSNEISLEDLARMTIGFSGAGLEVLMNESAISAVIKENTEIKKEDIDEAYFKIMTKGHKKESRDEMDKNELKLIAYHEAGHALCAKLLTNNSVPKVTIIPLTSGFGGVTFNIPKKMGLFSKNDILNNIRVLYAGRAAEYILTKDEGRVTIGASQDIEQATLHLKKYFNDYGMSEEFGLVRISEFSRNGGLMASKAIELSKDLYNSTLDLLQNNRDILDKIANELMARETLNEEDLDVILNKDR